MYGENKHGTNFYRDWDSWGSKCAMGIAICQILDHKGIVFPGYSLIFGLPRLLGTLGFQPHEIKIDYLSIHEF